MSHESKKGHENLANISQNKSTSRPPGKKSGSNVKSAHNVHNSESSKEATDLNVTKQEIDNVEQRYDETVASLNAANDQNIFLSERLEAIRKEKARQDETISDINTSLKELKTVNAELRDLAAVQNDIISDRDAHNNELAAKLKVISEENAALQSEKAKWTQSHFRHDINDSSMQTDSIDYTEGTNLNLHEHLSGEPEDWLDCPTISPIKQCPTHFASNTSPLCKHSHFTTQNLGHSSQCSYEEASSLFEAVMSRNCPKHRLKPCSICGYRYMSDSPFEEVEEVEFEHHHVYDYDSREHTFCHHPSHKPTDKPASNPSTADKPAGHHHHEPRPPSDIPSVAHDHHHGHIHVVNLPSDHPRVHLDNPKPSQPAPHHTHDVHQSHNPSDVPPSISHNHDHKPPPVSVDHGHSRKPPADKPIRPNPSRPTTWIEYDYPGAVPIVLPDKPVSNPITSKPSKPNSKPIMQVLDHLWHTHSDAQTILSDQDLHHHHHEDYVDDDQYDTHNHHHNEYIHITPTPNPGFVPTVQHHSHSTHPSVCTGGANSVDDHSHAHHSHSHSFEAPCNNLNHHHHVHLNQSAESGYYYDPNIPGVKFVPVPRCDTTTASKDNGSVRPTSRTNASISNVPSSSDGCVPNKGKTNITQNNSGTTKTIKINYTADSMSPSGYFCIYQSIEGVIPKSNKVQLLAWKSVTCAPGKSVAVSWEEKYSLHWNTQRPNRDGNGVSRRFGTVEVNATKGSVFSFTAPKDRPQLAIRDAKTIANKIVVQPQLPLGDPYYISLGMADSPFVKVPLDGVITFSIHTPVYYIVFGNYPSGTVLFPGLIAKSFNISELVTGNSSNSVDFDGHDFVACTN